MTDEQLEQYNELSKNQDEIRDLISKYNDSSSYQAKENIYSQLKDLLPSGTNPEMIKAIAGDSSFADQYANMADQSSQFNDAKSKWIDYVKEKLLGDSIYKGMYNKSGQSEGYLKYLWNKAYSDFNNNPFADVMRDKFVEKYGNDIPLAGEYDTIMNNWLSNYISSTPQAKAQAEANEMTAAANVSNSENADAAQQQAYSNYVQNAMAGINRSRAGMLGSQNINSDSTENTQQNYVQNRQLGTSTQNDYLQKMSQAKAADQTANNLQAGRGWNIASGIMQGMGNGIRSDENVKEPVSDTDLMRAVRQFKRLKKELDDLKKERQQCSEQ